MSAADLRERLAADAQDLFARVGLCIAVERDRALQRLLRDFVGASEREPLVVGAPGSHGWMLIGGEQAPQILRKAPVGVHRVVIDELANRNDDILREIVAATWRMPVQAEAVSLLAPFFDAALTPSREQIASLLRWAPVLERSAYRYFTRAADLLDEVRGSLLTPNHSRHRNEELLAYWRCLHSMGRLLTIASTPGARPWLSDMAASFTWVKWTPTMILVRERTLWLAAAAAKSAVAFGENVIDKYLTRLSVSDHPMKSFDALVGLVAIGLDQPQMAGNLISELIKAKAAVLRFDPVSERHNRPMFDSAVTTLREPDASERRFTRFSQDNGAPEILGSDALRRDPTDFLPEGQVVGLAALPAIVRSDPTDYYPQRDPTPQRFMIKPREVEEVLKRAWGPPSAVSLKHAVH